MIEDLLCLGLFDILHFFVVCTYGIYLSNKFIYIVLNSNNVSWQHGGADFLNINTMKYYIFSGAYGVGQDVQLKSILIFFINSKQEGNLIFSKAKERQTIYFRLVGKHNLQYLAFPEKDVQNLILLNLY